MKNILVVTGGAGFVGSNLIEFFILKIEYFVFLMRYSIKFDPTNPAPPVITK